MLDAVEYGDYYNRCVLMKLLTCIWLVVECSEFFTT